MVYRLDRSFFWSSFAKCGGILSQYGIITLLSQALSASEFGVWAVLMQLAMFVSLCDLGIGGGALRNKLIELQKISQDQEAERRLFCLSFWVVGLIACVILFLSLLGWPWMAKRLFGELPQDIPLSRLVPVFLCSLLFRLPLNLHGSGFYAYHEVNLKSYVELLEALILFLGVYAVVMWGCNFSLCVVVYYTLVFLMAAFGFYGFLKKRRWKMCWGSWEMSKSLFKTHLLFWFQNIVSLVLFSLMPLYVSFLGGAALAGEYFLVYKICTLFLGIHFAILNPLWSAHCHRFYAGKYEEITWWHQRAFVFTLVGFNLASLGMILWYQPIIVFWTGKKLICKEVVVALGIWMTLYGVINCFSVVLNAVNAVKRQLVFLSVGACIQLWLGMVFGRAYGVVGVVIAAIIALLPLLFSNIIEVQSVLRRGRVS